MVAAVIEKLSADDHTDDGDRADPQEGRQATFLGNPAGYRDDCHEVKDREPDFNQPCEAPSDSRNCSSDLESRLPCTQVFLRGSGWGSHGPPGEEAAVGAESEANDRVVPMTSEEPAAARDEIMRLSSMIAAATGKLLRLVGEYEERGNLGWEATPSDWLAWAAGMKPHTARAHVGLARRLKTCLKIAAALEGGEISVDKAARIASADTEDMLVEWARHGLASQLHSVVAGYRRARRADGDAPDKDHLLRYLSYYFDEDGSFLLKGRLSAEDGAVVAKALDATLDAMWKRDRVGHDTSPTANDAADADVGAATDDVADVSVTHGPERRADALVMMADTVLATEARTRSTAERYQVVVHVDESSLAGRETAAVSLMPASASASLPRPPPASRATQASSRS
jgi:hypothetical protein